MGSSAAPTPLRRIALGCATVVAVGLTFAPAASADFTLSPCQGEGIVGRGASFQNSAIAGFRTAYQRSAPDGCGSAAPSILYDPAGSGAGRAAFGARTTANPNQDRDPATRFAGTDEPPTPTERQQIERGPIDANGQDVTAADDGKMHVIPVAIGAIAVIVRLPDGCDYSGATLTRDRPTMTNQDLEQVFAGETTTWGDAIGGLSAGCAGQPIKRVVRLDSSGTTFSFKQFLAAINPARNWGALGNIAWPNDSGATAVTRPVTNGNGPVVTLANNTAGSIAYSDLATVRNATGQPFTWGSAADTTFWLPVQRRDTGTYDDPQAAPTGYKTGDPSPRGANCASVDPRNVPDDSYGNWFPVDSTYTTTGYGACALTYDLAFDDNSTVYCNSAIEERKARTLKDYLEKGVVSDAGQASLLGTDYDALPGFTGAGNAATPGSILAKARAAVASIDWKKGTSGRPCSAPPVTPDTTPATTTTPGAGGSAGGGTTPPPAAVSNVFTVRSARIVGTTVRLSLQMPGAGSLGIAATGKPRRGTSVRQARRSVVVAGAGTQRVTVTLTSKARRALTRTRRLRLTMRLTFLPQGGTARTVTRTVTFTVSKQKARR